MGVFNTPVDIANVGLQLLGVPRISTFTDATRQSREAGFVYEKSRRSELRRFVWTFATRRAVLRPVTATTKQMVLPAYVAGTTYKLGDLVTYNNLNYQSQAASNVGNTPDQGAGWWDVYGGPLFGDVWSAVVTYIPGDIVYKTGGTVAYQLSTITTSLNQDPASGAPWITPTGVTLSAVITYRQPSGWDGPTGATTRSAYPLPPGLLRMAPQDPKQPAIERLGTTAGMQFNDWEIEGGTLFSAAATGALILRFVCDTVYVTSYDDMFAHAVGCRMALDLNEILTQRQDLAQKVRVEYDNFVRDARLVSAIEGGSTEEDIMLGYQGRLPTPPQGQGRGGV